MTASDLTTATAMNESEVFGHSLLDRFASARMARVAGVLVAVLLAAFAPIQALAHQFNLGNFVTPFATFAPSAAVGYVVARRQPGNPIGWLLLLGIGGGVFGTELGYYGWAVYGAGERSLPLGWLAVIIGETDPTKILYAFPLVIALFPDGRAPSRLWRRGLVAFTVLGVLHAAAALVYAGIALINDRVGPQTLDPTGGHGFLFNQPPDVHWLTLAQLPFLLAFAILVVTSVLYQVLRYRGASGDRRQQLKWLMAGGAVCLLSVAAIASGAANANGGGSLATQVWARVPWIAFSALPISIGIAVLKHRLYEIDRLISRTLSYAILTALLGGTFVGLVALITRLLPFSSPVGVAAATLAAAAVFNPLRVRVQRIVDRRFNRARYDAEKTVVAFAARLRDAVDIDSIRADLLDAVNLAVQPSHASVWINTPDRRASTPSGEA